MTTNHRPYRDIPTQHKPPEWGTIIGWLIVVCFFLYIFWQGMARVFDRMEIKRTLSPVEKAEHDRLLRKHGLDGASVVLVKDNGLFFERDGRLNKFQ